VAGRGQRSKVQHPGCWLLAACCWQKHGTSYGFWIVDFSLTEPTEILEKNFFYLKNARIFFGGVLSLKWQAHAKVPGSQQPVASCQRPAARELRREFYWTICAKMI
jgi:hypothetical protein